LSTSVIVQAEKQTDICSLKEYLKGMVFSNTVNAMSIYTLDEYSPVDNKVALTNFNQWTNNNNEQKVEKDILLKNKKEIQKLFDDLDFVGNSDVLFFNEEAPIRLIEFNGEKCLVVNIFSDKIFNTLRTNSKDRATKIISDRAIPLLNVIYKQFKDTNISYLGVTVTYGSKNFSHSDMITPDSEVLSAIVSKKIFKEFDNLSITEKDLINKLNLYLKDRNMKIGTVKKINI